MNRISRSNDVSRCSALPVDPRGSFVALRCCELLNPSASVSKAAPTAASSRHLQVGIVFFDENQGPTAYSNSPTKADHPARTKDGRPCGCAMSPAPATPSLAPCTSKAVRLLADSRSDASTCEGQSDRTRIILGLISSQQPPPSHSLIPQSATLPPTITVPPPAIGKPIIKNPFLVLGTPLPRRSSLLGPVRRNLQSRPAFPLSIPQTRLYKKVLRQAYFRALRKHAHQSKRPAED